MSLRSKVTIFTLGVIAAVAGLCHAFTSLEHTPVPLASAVWGS
jgi:flagellar motor component MotA